MHQQDVRAVGVWIRVSTDDQAQGDSPTIHKARAEQYAQFKGWQIVETYDLSGVSGKAVIEHPEAKRMLEDVKRGRISALLFSKLARMARSTKELLEFSEIFREYNADLISLQENIDTSTPSGRLFYTMIAAMAQWEREEIVDRVKAAVVTRAKMGKQVGGAAPYGYQWKNDEMVPHPDEAPVRALIYELFAQYERKGTVRRILTERGYRTRRGKAFSISTIQLLLRDPTAKGLRRSNYTQVESRGATVKFKPEDEWEWHPCEAIVSKELWERCNAILDRQAKSNPVGPRGKYLFAGKVKCQHDGQTMYVLNESPKFVCPKCRGKIPQDDLEAIFRDRLRAFFSSKDEISAYLSNSEEEIRAKSEQMGVLKRERATIGDDRDKLLRGYLDGTIEPVRYKQVDGEAAAREEAIDLSVAALEGELAALQVAQDSSEEVVAGAQALYDRWDDLTHDQKVTVINTITEEIVIGDRDIAIHLRYVPTPQETGQTIQNTFNLLPSGSRK